MAAFDDVHTHLTHGAFAEDTADVVARAVSSGARFIVSNGTEPGSNRRVLGLAHRFEHVLPALGLYPIDAAAAFIDHARWGREGYDPPTPFDVDAEIAFIDAMGPYIAAVGECGLDAYWYQDDAFAREQERVLLALCEVAKRHDLPLILHTRKAELRTFEIVRDAGVRRADFHCFGGRLVLARQIAESGYYLSIPAVVERAESFQRIVQSVPPEQLLTETDAPYLSAERGARSEPSEALRSASTIARLLGRDLDEVSAQLCANFDRLFGGAPARAQASRGELLQHAVAAAASSGAQAV